MSRMKVIALSLAAAALVAAPHAVRAQDAKVGFVNVQFLMTNSPQMAEIQEKLQTEFAPREAEFQVLVEELNAKADRLERDRALMSQQEATALERELTQGEIDANRRQTALQEDFNLRRDELLGQLQQTIVSETQKFAEAEGFDLIVASALYVDDSVDITTQVLEAIRAAAETANGAADDASD